MARRVVVENRKYGCGHGCLMTFAWLIVAAAFVAVLPYVGAVAAGVGLWFLIRYIWRQYVQQRPDAPLVQRGLKFAPITRKILCTLFCALVSLCLLGVFLGMDGDSTQNAASQPAQEATQTTQDSSSKRTSETNQQAATDSGSDSKAAASDQGEDADSKASAKAVKAADPKTAGLQEFISYYNSKASTPFNQTGTFDPKDENSGHYRHEYRLDAYDDSQGVTGTIGAATVDFVKYRDGIRMYAEAPNGDYNTLMTVFEDAVHVYDPSADQAKIDENKQEYLSGEDNREFYFDGISDSLKGFVMSNKMFVEKR